MRLAARSTVVVICLAIVALAPVAASARPAFDPTHVVVNPTSTGFTTPQGQTDRPSRVLNPNHDQQVGAHHAVVPIPPILGKTQAAEQAAIDRLKAQHYTDKLPVSAAYSTATFNGYGSGHPVSVQAPNSPSANPDNAFDWGDAAIGAAASLALTMLVVGAARVISRRRSRQGDSATVATT